MSASIVRGRVLVGDALVEGGVVVSGGCIDAILGADEARASALPERAPGGDPARRIVAPGFIDLQVNGAFGVDAAEGSDAIVALSAALLRTGVTSFLPTLVSAERDTYAAAFAAVERAGEEARGAEPLGLHLEGPWLSPARAGAHRREIVAGASLEWIDAIPPPPSVRLITLAPERDGAIAAIARLASRGIVVSVGHTAADYDTVRAAADAGATMATHLFNAMSPLHHREPGPAGAALDDARIVAGLIADGIHVHPALARIAIRVKGPDGVALVTDAMSAAGMAPGTYALGGQEVTVDASSARLADGTLAGSVLTMDAAVRNVVAWGAATVPEALRMASEIPARVLGLADRGRIAVGLRADLVVLDERLAVLTAVSATRA